MLGFRPLLHPPSEVVAVCLTVVVACTGCCLIWQKSSRDKSTSASRTCHNYLLSLIHLSNYPWRVVSLPEYHGGVGSVNTCLIYENQLISKILQLPIPLVDARRNATMFCLSDYTFPGPLPPVPTFMYQFSKTFCQCLVGRRELLLKCAKLCDLK